MTGVDLLLCHGMVPTDRFRDRAAAAAAAGSRALAVDLASYRRHREHGESDADLRAAADDHGVAVEEIWSLYGLLDPTQTARGLDHLDRLAGVAAVFGARTIGAPTGFAGDLGAAAAALAAIAERAATHGLTIGLEPVAVTGLDDVSVAARIIDLADQPNVGLIVDCWHYLRGRSSISAIAGIPPGRYRSIQLNDGWRRPRVADPLEETRRFRPLPGDGELPVADLVRAVAAHAGDIRWSVEVGTDELDGVPSAQAAATLVGRCREFVAEALGEGLGEVAR